MALTDDSASYTQTTLLVPLSRPMILVGDGQFGFLSNQFGFTVAGPSGQVVVVETSTNLFDWQELTSGSLGSNGLYVADSESAIFPMRFYRVRLQ